MSEKKDIYPQMASAPPNSMRKDDFFQHRGPPPSYEESQKPDNRAPPPNYFTTVNPAQVNGPQSNQYPGFITQPYVGSSVSGNSFPNTAQQFAGGYNVVEFDAGARFKGRGSGSVTVPPPPPGCLPTAAQLAALQGHPVVLKKKKNSFF